MAAFADVSPEIVILDIGMPGYATARKIRDSAADRGQSVMLVALAGWGQASDKTRAVEAGFDHHFTRPWIRTVSCR